MDLIKDLRALRKEKSKLDSAKAQLRKRSKDSIARPKAKKNLLKYETKIHGKIAFGISSQLKHRMATMLSQDKSL